MLNGKRQSRKRAEVESLMKTLISIQNIWSLLPKKSPHRISWIRKRNRKMIQLKLPPWPRNWKFWHQCQRRNTLILWHHLRKLVGTTTSYSMLTDQNTHSTGNRRTRPIMPLNLSNPCTSVHLLKSRQLSNPKSETFQMGNFKFE